MRIAVITNAYPPKARGGAGRIAQKQVELLRAAGHEVKVWIGSLDWISYPALVRLSFHSMDLVYPFPFVKDINAWNPDVLITHNLTGCGWSTPSMIQRKGTKWVHVLHDVQLFEPSGSLVSADQMTWWQRLWTNLRRPVFSTPDVVVSPTKWLFDQHVRRGWFHDVASVILPNPAPPKQEREETSPIPKILFVGRFDKDKGSDILRSLVTQVNGPVEWHFVGANTQAMSAFSVPESVKIVVHGMCEEQEILSLMRKADILLVPSQIEENQPTVILEAMACGLPVIASDKGGIPETVNEAGIILPANDLEAWKNAIEKVLVQRGSQEYRDAISRAWERFSPETYFMGLLEVLKSNRNK